MQLIFDRNHAEKIVIIKAVQGHPRVENERDVLKQDPNRKELRYTPKRILEVLKVLHEEDYVHTMNYREDSKYAKEGIPVGAPMWSSPEVIMEMPWNTATDIWSFGAMLINLTYGGDFNLFRPRTVPYGHEEYGLEALKRQFQYFGSSPAKYEEIASPETMQAILYLMQEIPKSKTTPFYTTTKNEICKKDKEFIGKIMVLDWRDRPTAKELLKDDWLKEDTGE
ncbi:kinase-like domain-containing protein [Phaeosphaeriaceae sp. PMI808]|nr:kinase-like domain-containing protein [Phaeosphaeriaceae sp. PMI808]